MWRYIGAYWKHGDLQSIVDFEGQARDAGHALELIAATLGGEPFDRVNVVLMKHAEARKEEQQEPPSNADIRAAHGDYVLDRERGK